MTETTIMAHADCDGICSAAIALTRFPESRVFFSKPVSLFRDLNEMQTGRIVICDISINSRDALKTIELMKRKSKNSEILYFDHHALKDHGLQKAVKESVTLHAFSRSASASEAIYRYFRDEIPPERVWCALYGAIGDYTESTEFVQKMLKDWDKRAIYFEVSTIVMGIKNETFGTYDMKRKLVHLLSEGKNPSDLDGLVREARLAVNREFELYDLVKANAKIFGHIGYVKDVYHFGFRGPAALFSATVTDRPVGLCIFEKEGHTDITMRSRDSTLDLGDLADRAASRAGGSGGGHPQAAGARVGHHSLKDFVQELDRLLSTKRKP